MQKSTMYGAEFLQRFRWLIFYTWNIPPIFGLSFILLIGTLTPRQLLGILITPLEPAYIIAWIVFTMWYFPYHMRPLVDWLDRKPNANPDTALRAIQQFSLRFWAAFLIYLVIAPFSVVAAAQIFTDYVPTMRDLFRIELVALIVSIIVGLPIFFLILDLFGRAAGDIKLRQPIVTIKTKVFLIGALVPLLIDTMLVQYYWTRTGFFSAETFGVWLVLEVLAIGGSLIFAHSFGQSLEPMHTSIVSADPMAAENIVVLKPQSMDELGMLTSRYRQLLDELRVRTEILEMKNRVLREAYASTATADIINEAIRICQESVGGELVFLLLLDDTREELIGIAQTGTGYRPEGYFRIRLDEVSLAVETIKTNKTIAVPNCATDSRVNPNMVHRFNIISTLTVPMRVHGNLIGVLMTSTQTHRHDYTDREIVLMEALANEVAAAIHTQKLQEARQHEAKRVRLLLDATAEAIYGVDINGLCTFVNPACVRMLGYQRESDLIGKSMHVLINHSHPDKSPYPIEHARIQTTLHEGLPVHVIDEVHWRQNGSAFPVEYWAHPIYQDNALTGAVVTFIDVSERIRAEQELHEINATLELRVTQRTAELALINQELEAFSYSVSHDLRAPLRAIDGFSMALAEEYAKQLGDNGQDYLQRIRNAAQTMGQLIDDLLKLARVTRSPLQMSPVNLSVLVRQITARIQEAHPHRKCHIKIAADGDVIGDPGLLRIAMENLIDNAWKYTANRDTAEIEFNQTKQDGHTVYYLRDNGVGFDMQYASKLFGAFQRLHHKSEFEGTGIGLATVKRIIHRHNGRIWAEAELGKGATFYFTLGQ